MNAYFFGASARPLYGIFGPALGPRPRAEGVLLCTSIGHEYLRLHWALRQLRQELQRAGYAVFRFDYAGHGDSWGDFPETTVADWLESVHSAAQELQASAGVRRLVLLGVRLGATFACLAAPRLPVAELVLWDPVRGTDFVANLRARQRERCVLLPQLPLPVPGAAHEDLLGFRYTAAQLADIAAVEPVLSPAPATVFQSSQGESAAHVNEWEQHELFTTPVRPQRLQQAIVDHLTKRPQ